ncbi:hypothetical protein C440_11218 [Haloferax mucosum ATCC BAA-1512]|uniref:Uncharacterized protein n=1 Tax=Haloferax mucosum ATCC BAA-1512 TaxID=662479 RepID=M0IDP1_9EURY|nr:hypothetical protein [Haloferax mucosum]ELZ94187.1 hypothetical protein C440_11218 [Haloferax mucosum ATCC BAA-1512]
MANFTLFEVHLHDGFEFSPSNRAPFFNTDSETTGEDVELEPEHEYEADERHELDDESDSGGSGAMALLFGLVLLVGIAAAVRFLRGDAELDDLADLDDHEEVEIDA